VEALQDSIQGFYGIISLIQFELVLGVEEFEEFFPHIPRRDWLLTSFLREALTSQINETLDERLRNFGIGVEVVLEVSSSGAEA